MFPYKQIDDKYILSIGYGNQGIQITEEEYNQILNIIMNRPEVEEGYTCKLCLDLTWEIFKEEEVITDGN